MLQKHAMFFATGVIFFTGCMLSHLFTAKI